MSYVYSFYCTVNMESRALTREVTLIHMLEHPEETYASERGTFEGLASTRGQKCTASTH